MIGILANIAIGGMNIAKRAWDFATRNPVLAILAILALFSAWQTWRLSSATKARDAAVEAVRAEKQAHAQTVANYRAAADKAKAIQDANLDRVATEYAANSERIADDYQTRLADARARFERMRRDKANRGATGQAGLPAVPDTASGIDETPGGNGFSDERRLTATEQAIQLDSLISWVEAQARVVTSPE